MPGTQLKGAARQITAALRYARSHAVMTQQETLFRLAAAQADLPQPEDAGRSVGKRG